jgi:hypothetical protein
MIFYATVMRRRNLSGAPRVLCASIAIGTPPTMLHPVSLKGTSMSNRIHAALLAALLPVAAIALGPVFAQNTASDRNANSHSYYGNQPQANEVRTPSGARGFSAVPGIQHVETDPDAHIRFEMNRDDRDRRLGGS